MYLYAQGNRDCEGLSGGKNPTCLFSAEGIIALLCPSVWTPEICPVEVVLLLRCVIPPTAPSLFLSSHFNIAPVSLGTSTSVLQGPVAHSQRPPELHSSAERETAGVLSCGTSFGF